MTQRIEILAPSEMGGPFLLVEIRAENGARVEVGQLIAVIENEWATLELECSDKGVLEWAVAQGDTLRPGQLIGNIAVNDPPESCVLRIELDPAQTTALDQARGMLSRRDYLISRIPGIDG